jgi:hypothetical protein
VGLECVLCFKLHEDAMLAAGPEDMAFKRFDIPHQNSKVGGLVPFHRPANVIEKLPTEDI